MSITLAQLRAANSIRQGERWEKTKQLTMLYRAVELGGEAGEALNVVKKIEREALGLGGSKATLHDLGEELADVVICADLLAMKAGIDLEAALRDKFNKSSEQHNCKTRLP